MHQNNFTSAQEAKWGIIVPDFSVTKSN
jgi:hypothetical protein